MKTAVVSYSRYGSTTKVARALADRLGAELRTIESMKQYGFMGMGFRSTFNIRMPLKPMDMDFAGFDRVVLCAPIWAGKPACPARTFLRDAKLEGKQLAVIFSTATGRTDRAAEAASKDLAGKGVTSVAFGKAVTDKPTDEVLEQAALDIAGQLGA